MAWVSGVGKEVTETQSFMVSMRLTPLLHSHLLTPHQSSVSASQEDVSNPRPGVTSVFVRFYVRKMVAWMDSLKPNLSLCVSPSVQSD